MAEKSKHVVEYDGLRGALSTIVVVAHLIPSMGYWAWWTMDFFFCLSGFLLTSVVIRGLPVKGFLRSYAIGRILRIWPPYYACLLLTLAINLCLIGKLSGADWNASRDLFQNFLFVQNSERWFQATTEMSCVAGYAPFLCHTWSVALEEQFYVLLIPILWLILKTDRPLAASVLVIVCSLACGMLTRSHGWHWWALPARLDGFAVGLGLALAVPMLMQRPRHYIVPLAVACSVAGALFYAQLLTSDVSRGVITSGSPVVVYGVSIVAVVSACLLLLIHLYQGVAALSLLRIAPLVFLGRMSYSVYLWHFPAIYLSGRLLAHWDITNLGFYFFFQLICCYVAGYVGYRLFEEPSMRIKKKRAKQRDSTLRDSSFLKPMPISANAPKFG